MRVSRVPRFLFAAFALGFAAQGFFLTSRRPEWLSLAMWAPALAVLATGREEIGNTLRGLRNFPLRWVGVAALMGVLPFAISHALYWLTGTGQWNSIFVKTPDGSSLESIRNARLLLGTGAQSWPRFAANAALTLLASGAVTSFTLAIGEEIGWRGYLQPTLTRRYGTIQACLFVGLLWSYWHIPANLGGINGKDQAVLVTFVTFPLSITMITFAFGWLRERSGAVWPCAFFHGINNAFSGFELLRPRTPAAEQAVSVATHVLIGGFFLWRLVRERNSALRPRPEKAEGPEAKATGPSAHA